MRRRGNAVVAVIIIIIILVGAVIASQYLYQNRSITDLKTKVIARDYESYSGEYTDGVTLNLGPLKDSVAWDGKAVAEIALIGEYFRIQGAPIYLTGTPDLYKATKGHDPFIVGTCYRARITNSHIVISYGDYGLYSEIEVPLSEWSKWSAGMRAFLYQYKVSIEQDSYHLKIPVFSYLIQGTGTVVFEKGYDSVLSNGCKDWQSTRTTTLRTPDNIFIQVGMGP